MGWGEGSGVGTGGVGWGWGAGRGAAWLREPPSFLLRGRSRAGGGGGGAWGRGGMAGAKLSSHPASGKAPQAEPAKVLQMF